MEKVTCHFVDLIQAVPLFIAGDFFGRPFDDRQGEVCPFGQSFDGIGKGKVFFFHNELEDIAMSMAAETIEKAFVGSDAEGGGLFIMERAAGPKVPALPFQRHVIGDDADNVIGLSDLFDKFAGKPFHSYHLFHFNNADVYIILYPPVKFLLQGTLFSRKS